MKTRIYLLISIFLFCGLLKAEAQNPDESYSAGLKQFKDSFAEFKDSINYVFAKYLAKSWELFKVEPPLERPRKPDPPKMPVYIPDDTAVADVTVVAEPAQIDTTFIEPVIPKNNKQVVIEKSNTGSTINFFGNSLTFIPVEGYLTTLTGINEKQVAAYWMQLSKTDFSNFVADLIRKETALGLNSWGFYQLVLKWADAHFTEQQKDEKNIFIVYVLNKAGYKAKIGRVNNNLFVMMAFLNKIYGKSYTRIGDDSYYIFSDQPTRAVASYRLNYETVTSYIDLRIQTFPRVKENISTVKRTFKEKEYAFKCNNNLTNFYKTIPQTDPGIYGNTPFSAIATQSVVEELTNDLQNKTATEKLKFLLALIQYGFEYKTDEEQFGRETFFFAEETLFYPYSDCEDRAILFCRMVKLLCNFDTLLIDYPNHVASAVKSNEPGDAVIYNNERYIVCDPSYIGASIGRTMVGCDNAKARIIPIR